MSDRILRHPFQIPVDAINTGELLNRVIGWAKTSHPRFITYLNAHCINICFRDPAYLEIVRSSDLVYADGQAVVWASRFLKSPLPERVNAGDFFLRFCRLCSSEDLPVYFLGSYPGVAARAAEHIREKVKGFRIAGARCGFFSPDEIPAITSEIKESGAAIILVGMGVPLQEKFAYQHFREWNVPVTWCVGALFEYYAGLTPRAPVWIRKAGMEWLFRLLCEPRRLWRRYIPGNLSFIYKTLRFRLTGK